MRGFLTTLLMAAFHFAFCQEQAMGPETVLDEVVHLEDSIRHVVPKLPRLCDSADSVKEQVDIGGCTLFVEQQGEGIPMVLINGGPGGTHHYFHPWFSEISNTH